MPDTHKESDLPALYSAHLESNVLGLAVRQGHTAADLVVADGKYSRAAGFGVVAGTGIQLNVPIVPDLLGPLQKLLQGGVREKETRYRAHGCGGDGGGGDRGGGSVLLPAGETHIWGGGYSQQSSLLLERPNEALSPAFSPALTPNPTPV